MTAQILGSELSILVQESKRKLPELRNAAEKSLQDLKALTVTSETQLAADLARKPQFIDPFIIACSSRNGKFVAPAMACLQRLAVSSAIPRGRLKEVVDALKDCASLGVDIQLRILQILPPLLQNYSDSVQGDLLFVALEICSALQTSKTQAISGTAAATLQQLILSVFEQLNADSSDMRTVTQISINDRQISLTASAYDAYRILVDLCSMAQGGKLQFIHFSNSISTSILELIEPIMTNYAACIRSHEELSNILRNDLLPLLIRQFSEKQTFPLTLRSIRLINLVLRQYIDLFSPECEAALVVIVRMLDPEVAPPWKRALCLEVLRGVFSDHDVILRIHGKLSSDTPSSKIMRDSLSAFVRIASEKPALIGLGQISTVPIGNYFQREASGDRREEQAMTSSGSAIVGVPTATVPGISLQFSSMKGLCLDQLDKAEPPALTETYIYSLVLMGLTELAESMAKFILPLTVQTSAKGRKRPKPKDSSAAESTEDITSTSNQLEDRKGELKRSHSYRKRTVPQNPMALEDHPAEEDIHIAASLVEDTWPAVLACCSTFFNSALDADYYRALVRAFQKFAQVVGLLRMSTPRDAFLTTLGKAAIPPHALTASSSIANSQSAQSPSVLNSAKVFLNVENIVTQASNFLPDRTRRSSLDSQEVAMNARNLLCLRALLNLAIALGPLLDSSWSIVLETMQQAEAILAARRMRPVSRDRPGTQTPTQTASDLSNTPSLGSEITAVQAAASRLFESTVDFPNESFNYVLQALRNLLHFEQTPLSPTKLSSPQTPTHQRRMPSYSGISIRTEANEQDPVFALDKLKQLGGLNLDRFVDYEPAESGWKLIIDMAIPIATGANNAVPTARLSAVEAISRLCQQVFASSLSEDLETRNELQERALSPILTISKSLHQIETASGRSSATEMDLQVHLIALEALRAMLERGGDSLHAAWRLIFSTILTTFDGRTQWQNGNGVAESKTVANEKSALLSTALGRSAFSSLQLTCSDFLSTVPDEVLLPLTNLLFAFASQPQDLNISLTTTTLFWNLSDFLYGKIKPEELDYATDEEFKQLSKASSETYGLYEIQTGESLISLWLLVLHHITAVIKDSREEVRNGAVHTIIRIFDNHGDDLSPRAWELCIRRILMQIMSVDLISYHEVLPAATESPEFEPSPNDIKGKVATSKLIVEGMCKLFAAHIKTIIRAPHFREIWHSLFSALEANVQLALLDLSAEVYSDISGILSRLPSVDSIGSDLIDRVWSIWTSDFPTGDPRLPAQDNKAALLAYLKVFDQLYRLQPSILNHEGSLNVAKQLKRCIENAVPSAYSTDVDNLTTVQAAVLQTLSTIKTTTAQIALPIVNTMASFIIAPFQPSQGNTPTNATFIALSKKTMEVLETLITRHVNDDATIMEPPLLTALENLKKSIQLKYEWTTQDKPPALWQMATTTSLKILKILIPRLAKVPLEQDILHRYWKTIIQASRAVAETTDDSVRSMPEQILLKDEQFDIESIKSFHSIMIPSMGDVSISDSERRTYASMLFKTSILHSMEHGDLPDYHNEPLAGIYDVRFGRTFKPAPVLRYEMAYCCLDLLISLVTAADSSPERVRLSQAAAPYLILRCALPLRAYVADQPLRGRMPQPTSEREELLFILRRLREMKSEPRAIPDAEGTRSLYKKHLLRLYPLISKAVPVAAMDPVVLKELQACLSVLGDDFGL